jgi:hypothetical protein
MVRKVNMETANNRNGMSVRRIFILLLISLGLAGHARTAIAQSAGMFTSTGNMITSRVFHRATLLFSGKVLIAGGDNSSSAELYDPSTGTFTATSNMTTLRAVYSATLLPNGRVLLTGASRDRPLSAELYDPSTGTFTATGEMIAPGAFATLLSSGKVLFLGFRTAQLYDPDTGTFVATGPYAGDGGTGVYAASLLADGQVLIAGNVNGNYEVQRNEIYNPSTGTFTLTGALQNVPVYGGALNFSVFEPPAILLMNGKVLFVGANNDDFTATGVANAEIYDSSSGGFTVVGNMTTARLNPTLTLLPDGTILISGSQITGSNGGSALASAELFDPGTGTFSATGDMVTPRFGHTATLLADGTVLVAGGTANANGGSPGARAEIYHPDVLVPAPALLSLSGDGQGQGAILHSDTYQVVSQSDPAIAGEALEIYCVGLVDGNVIPPQLAIGGRVAEILFFGNARGFEGLNQVKVRVPSGVAAGPAVSVRLTYLGRPSNEVTIALR